MSEILVIVPSEWVLQDTDAAVNLGGMSVDWYAQLGQATTDLNATLRANGYFPEGSNSWVQDVLVVAGNVYFKFDIIRD